ncbi:type II toxin-antitoxin system Phd/YefM family antitoxin [Pseudomonas sp. NP21570]|nr:type II toxin-antitoxin system Phd/YefM family antitoxin [Pseudomonas sp. NP21570]
MRSVLADVAVGISELKKNPSAVMVRAGGMPVALLNDNRAIAYLVPAELYEQMIERLDDLDLVDTAKARSTEKPIPVIFDDL